MKYTKRPIQAFDLFALSWNVSKILFILKFDDVATKAVVFHFNELNKNDLSKSRLLLYICIQLSVYNLSKIANMVTERALYSLLGAKITVIKFRLLKKFFSILR